MLITKLGDLFDTNHANTFQTMNLEKDKYFLYNQDTKSYINPAVNPKNVSINLI